MKNNPNQHTTNDLYKPSIYTDLALEASQLAMEEKEDAQELDGISIRTEEDQEHGILLTWVEVLDEAGAKSIGKPVGNYVTLECPGIKENDIDLHELIIQILSEQLGKLHNLDREATILIIGLGNWHVTPDALGPKVVEKILVTRHIIENIPEDIRGHVRSVSALSPGVMGTTGIETRETVKGLVDRVKPDLLIAIDALAARNVSRINATIQISDTGLAPGAGMGNMRKMLNQETLGIPVIAIGVPTVVDAATLVNDTMDQMLDEMIEASKENAGFYQMLTDFDRDEKYDLIYQLLDPYTGNMFVTPKEVDAVIEHLSNIIANALNISLHPGITKEDINRYMY